MARRILVGAGAMVLALLMARALIPKGGTFEPPADPAPRWGDVSLLWEEMEGVPADSFFQTLAERARMRAGRPWVAPPTELPPPLGSLDYDGYRSIRFRPESALWRDLDSFQLQFFHLGGSYSQPVEMVEVADGQLRSIPFRREDFDYPGAPPDPSPSHYAGFRIHFPMNRPEVADEVAVFLGASYFRLLGPGQVHGISGRGIAVNTPLESGEEFPDFRQFWVERPAPGATTLRFHALLDGPSVTGAYRFELEPGGRSTVLEVEARLFARQDIARLGLAPLTSMYLFGPTAPHPHDDIRGRVHDSDGVLMATAAGEWIWRPLSNREGLHVTSLRGAPPVGFGLLQRERDFGEYLDLEARYHLRPSLWVEVLEGDWGEGGVEIVEIPTSSEFFDNIAAYWAPNGVFAAGEERHFRYRLHTFQETTPPVTGADRPGSGLAWVERTREGAASLPGETNPLPAAVRRFVVDFRVPDRPSGAGGIAGQPSHPGSGDRALPVPDPTLETSSGRVSDVQIVPLEDDSGWRATFRLEPDGTQGVDMRLFLQRDGVPVSETWSYFWVPSRGGKP